ncbi:helix-turn-helix transcriptional regulator [Verrucomicrobia bacterium]|nr:helix-turn-helix transcriptional regulator [Verrucomicrobiota bacterium]
MEAIICFYHLFRRRRNLMPIFAHFGIAISLYSVLLILGKQTRLISDKILIFFLISLSLPMIPEIFGWRTFASEMLSHSMPLTLGPFMYLYSKSLTLRGCRLLGRNYLHLFPFLFSFILALSFSNFFDYVSSTTAFFETGTNVRMFFFNTLIFLSFTVYSVLTYLLLKEHRKSVPNHFAQLSNQITLQWLNWSVFLFFIVFMLGHLPRYVRAFESLINPVFFHAVVANIHGSGVVLFIIVLGYFGVRQSQLFPEVCDDEDIDVMPKIEEELLEEKTPGTYKFPRLSDADLTNYRAQLDQNMVNEKPYLDPDLTLAQLAGMMDLPKKRLTEAINRNYNKNFYNYINDFRIVEVKQRLQDPLNNSKTVLVLAFEVGFNSKTTFNTYFKKSVGMTPTQFRKNTAIVTSSVGP